MREVKINRARMSLTNMGLSALACPKCKIHYTLEQENLAMTSYRATCLMCMTETYVEDMRLTILPRYSEYLRADNVRGSVWYHATHHENWLERMLELDGPENSVLLHIGSVESALDRANVRNYDHLYAVKIDPSAVISPSIVDDSNDWPETVKMIPQYGTGEEYKDVTRYVNRYEIPGSISLLVDSRMLKVVSTKKI